ncbi:MAG: hypothetical protein WCV58_01515 [Patescibacteria group bacterium]|jgi:hypothetical protein
MDQNPQAEQSAPQKPNNKKLIIIVLLAVLVPIIIVVVILAVMVTKSTGGARDKAKDAVIKSQVTSIEAAAAVYHDTNQTFVGLEKDPQIVDIKNSIKQNNSELIFQTVTKDNFVGYAKLPSSGKLFCVTPFNTNESSTGSCELGQGLEVNNGTSTPSLTVPPTNQLE